MKKESSKGSDIALALKEYFASKRKKINSAEPNQLQMAREVFAS